MIFTSHRRNDSSKPVLVRGANETANASVTSQAETILPPSLSASTEIASQTKARAGEAFGKLPVYFVENRGQMDAQVGYYVQERNKALYFTQQGITFALTSRERTPAAARLHTEPPSLLPAAFRPGLGMPELGRPELGLSMVGRNAAEQQSQPQRWVVKLDFVGANPQVKLRGADQTEAVISYFKGSQAQWQTGLKTYATLVYEDLWPGIDLVYRGTVNRLKYTFIVKPGADPQQIKLAYRGASSVKLNAAGQLEVATPAGGFQDEKPYVYQEMDGRQVEVASAYALNGKDSKAAQVYGFQVGEYDKSKVLVLDPAVIVYCGYIVATTVTLHGARPWYPGKCG